MLAQNKVWVVSLNEYLPGVSGNKIAKLHFPLLRAQTEGFTGVLTFGGAFSNHLLATAAACKRAGLRSVGIVRTGAIDQNNPTLKACQQQGMTLIACNRDDYRKRHHAEFLSALQNRYPDYLIVPEGGTSLDGVAGVSQLNLSQTPDGQAKTVFCATGSGGTLAGLANGNPNAHVHGIAVVKDKQLLSTVQSLTNGQNWTLHHGYEGKGYAKFADREWQMVSLTQQQGIEVEPIYTAKALIGLHSLLPKLPTGPIVFFHTGGLQGLEGIAYRGLMPDRQLA